MWACWGILRLCADGEGGCSDAGCITISRSDQRLRAHWTGAKMARVYQPVSLETCVHAPSPTPHHGGALCAARALSGGGGGCAAPLRTRHTWACARTLACEVVRVCVLGLGRAVLGYAAWAAGGVGGGARPSSKASGEVAQVCWRPPASPHLQPATSRVSCRGLSRNHNPIATDRDRPRHDRDMTATWGWARWACTAGDAAAGGPGAGRNVASIGAGKPVACSFVIMTRSSCHTRPSRRPSPRSRLSWAAEHGLHLLSIVDARCCSSPG